MATREEGLAHTAPDVVEPEIKNLHLAKVPFVTPGDRKGAGQPTVTQRPARSTKDLSRPSRHNCSKRRDAPYALAILQDSGLYRELTQAVTGYIHSMPGSRVEVEAQLAHGLTGSRYRPHPLKTAVLRF